MLEDPFLSGAVAIDRTLNPRRMLHWEGQSGGWLAREWTAREAGIGDEIARWNGRQSVMLPAGE